MPSTLFFARFICVMHATCRSLALLPASGDMMYGWPHIQLLHTSGTSFVCTCLYNRF